MSKSVSFSAKARRRAMIGAVTAVSVGAICAAAAVATADAAVTSPVAAGKMASSVAAVDPAPWLTVPLPAGVALPAGVVLPAGVTVVPAAPVAAPALMYRQDNPRDVAHRIVPIDQFAAFDAIVTHESGWNTHARNASSGAYGLGQALPAGKMASAGADWRDNAETQIRWAYNYMNSRYGSPNAAWAFWQTHHWY